VRGYKLDPLHSKQLVVSLGALRSLDISNTVLVFMA